MAIVAVTLLSCSAPGTTDANGLFPTQPENVELSADLEDVVGAVRFKLKVGLDHSVGHPGRPRLRAKPSTLRMAGGSFAVKAGDRWYQHRPEPPIGK